MENRIIQYISIIAVLTTIVGSVWYFNSQGSTKVNSSQETKLTDGLVGHWTFDGNHMDWSATGAEVLDQAGNNDGDASSSGMNNSNAVPGKIGQALDFNGSSDYISAGDIDITDAITASAWINLEGFAGGIFPGIISKDYTTAWYFGMASNTRNLTIWINNNARATTSSNPINFNEWAHVAVTYDKDAGGTDEVKIYVNGSQVATGDYSTAIGTNNSNIEIGKNFGQEFDGKIDEVRLYDRALKQDEVSQLYRQGSAKINASQETKITDGLIGHWTLDGNHMDWGAANEVLDQAGSYDGSVTNMDNSNAVIGKVGQALSFDGSSEYVSMSGFTQYVDAPLSWSAWIKLNAVPTSTEKPVYKSGDFQIEITPTTVACNQDNTLRGVKKTITLNANEWYHIACSINLRGVASNPDDFLYINGVDSEGVSNGFAGADYGYTFTLGKGWQSSQYFNGQVDEVRVYDRAISGAEAVEIYNMGKTKINASQETKLTDGLVGNWTFDGNHMDWSAANEVLDQGTGSNDGDATNMDNSNAAIGKIGQALTLNGIDEHVNLGDVLDVGTGDFSISAWIKTDATSGGRRIISKYGGGVGYNTWIIPPAGPIWIQFDDGPNGGFSAGSMTGFNDGDWHHIVTVFDRDGIGEIYVDGIYDTGSDSIANAQGNLSNNGDMFIGSSGSGNYYEDQIDEVRMYNRTLTADEVNQLYMMGK